MNTKIVLRKIQLNMKIGFNEIIGTIKHKLFI